MLLEHELNTIIFALNQREKPLHSLALYNCYLEPYDNLDNLRLKTFISHCVGKVDTLDLRWNNIQAGKLEKIKKEIPAHSLPDIKINPKQEKHLSTIQSDKPSELVNVKTIAIKQYAAGFFSGLTATLGLELIGSCIAYGFAGATIFAGGPIAWVIAAGIILAGGLTGLLPRMY